MLKAEVVDVLDGGNGLVEFILTPVRAAFTACLNKSGNAAASLYHKAA